MPESPQTLLEAIAASLRDAVAPRIEDSFSRGQIAAAAEVLDNIAPRIQWREDILSGPYGQLRALLVDAAARAPGSTLTRTRAWLAAGHVQSLRGAWASALECLAEVQAWLAWPATAEAELKEGLAAFLRADHEREQRLLRTGMFSDRQPG